MCRRRPPTETRHIALEAVQFLENEAPKVVYRDKMQCLEKYYVLKVSREGRLQGQDTALRKVQFLENEPGLALSFRAHCPHIAGSLVGMLVYCLDVFIPTHLRYAFRYDV